MTVDATPTHPTVQAARDVAAILNLTKALLAQAVQHGDAPGMPGGEAMVALGKVANIEGWDNHQQATERHERGTWDDAFANYRRAYTSVEDEDPDDAWSAYQLIEFWSEAWRRERGDDYERRSTLLSEARYVAHCIEWAWENEIAWADFAADMRRARLRLEDIVYAGNRVERTRVLCDKCDNPRRLIKVHAIYDPTGVLDSYKCPACKERFTEDEYQRAYAAMLKSEGAERYVTQVEAIATLKTQGRGLRTIRRWLAPSMEAVDHCTECGADYERQEWNVCPRRIRDELCGGELVEGWRGDPEAVIRGYCEIDTHRVLLWWPDLWTKHLTTRQAQSVA